MTAAIATVEPAAPVVGDTWIWKRSLADYPAPTWTVTYYLRGRTGEQSFAAAASGADHLVTVAKATTAAYQPGAYQWVAVADDGTTRATVDSGVFEVQPDPTTLGAGFDPRTSNEKILESITAVLEKRATLDQESYSIAGRSLSRTPVAELITMQSKFKAYVLADKQAEALRKGGAVGGRLQVRF